MAADEVCARRLATDDSSHEERPDELALGTVAHAAVLRALGLPPGKYAFAHGAQHALPGGLMLYDSYHCSRYNTQTKRLNEVMFHAVFREVSNYLHSLETAHRI